MTALEGGIAAPSPPRPARPRSTYSVLNLTRAGDNIVSVTTLYGGTYNLFAHTLPQYGIEVRFADPDDPDALARLVDDKTRLVFAETIGNPKLNVIDIARLGRRRARAGPAADRRQHRADADPLPRRSTTAPTSSVHSATKYIGGHGTSIGGIIVDSGSFDWTAHAERFPG